MLRFVTTRPRLFAAFILMAATYPMTPPSWRMATRLLTAWDLGILTYLLTTALLFWREDASQVPEDAARQQEGEWTIFAITVLTVLASMIAIFGEFSVTHALHGSSKIFNVALIAVTLLVSWLMLHTTFSYRYAHEYYSPSISGHFAKGLEFPGEERPDYMDFLYFSIVLGMTFQVSDVQITSRSFRRLATLHGLLGFLFNTTILALSVNIGASLM
ncbi:MAG: DUF1345 domain-containing protein [Acidocella sp.]|nr:DUF1345 domain-containing protein [Acidocella sp.]